MKLKTYVARTLKEALGLVKEELGPEAVILSTRRLWLKQGALNLHRQPGVEVTAAIDPAPLSHAQPLGLPIADRDFRPNQALYRDPLKLPSNREEHPGWARWQTELQELKGLVRQLVRHSDSPAWLAHHRELQIFYRFLLKTGVDDNFLSNWLENIKRGLAQPLNNAQNWRELALRPLMNAFEVLNPWPEQQEGAQIWTFIGPTGVGKTTTIAKLAAHFSLAEKKNVGLISLDNYRLGAQSQLEAYARIIGMSLASAAEPPELMQLIDKFNDCDLILIDTAGRSPNRPELISELYRLFAGLSGVRHHLVLSATSEEMVLSKTINIFSMLPLTSYVVTKVDEAINFSGVFNLLCRHRTPVSYLTTGQRVPEDLELASRRRVAELLLNSPPLGNA
ncbi:MAG: flagellar biosynthesis protein FlhF [Desulfobacca sp. 4484_104]|nr:MAG: flagellar biosynthesis protein FlhF [Desulfobacca sp. 4484_104]RLA88961.1 MAG: flagellar biosynthesis protein FlhF [Deltaproteobacteria bacterium]